MLIANQGTKKNHLKSIKKLLLDNNTMPTNINYFMSL